MPRNAHFAGTDNQRGVHAEHHNTLGAAIDQLGFNVMDPAYGAVGDRVADDTAAIQAAIHAAVAVGGNVIFPQPSVGYKVTSTLTIQPPDGETEAYVNLTGIGGQSRPIVWEGADNTPVFTTRGWRLSRASNIHVLVPTDAAGVEGWDIDNTGDLVTNPNPPFTISSALLSFYDSSVFFDTGTSNGYGWRLGGSGNNTDISCINWHNCMVFGGGAYTNGHMGWSIEQPNAIGLNWFGGIGFYLNRMVRLKFGEGLYTHGLCGSHNNEDFRLDVPGSLVVVGGRFEFGQRLLAVEHNTPQGQPITFSGTKTYRYTVGDGMVFHVLGTPTLNLDNVEIVNRSGSNYTNALVSMYCDGAGVGTLNVRGGIFQAADPFFRTVGGSTATFTTYLSGAVKVNNVGESTALFTVRP